MVSLFQGSVLTTLTTSGLRNPTLSSVTTLSGATSNGCCCPSSTVFLQTLTDKLILMTTSLKKQFADLEANSRATQVAGRGAFLASIEIKGEITFNAEYFIYVMRYGPPVRGIFDPVYLELIRAELLTETA